MQGGIHRTEPAWEPLWPSVCARQDLVVCSHANGRLWWPAELRQCSAASVLAGPPAAANGDDAIMGLQHIAVARDLQALVAVGHNQRSLRTSPEWQHRL